jgi:hypothetical protein
VAFVEHDDEIEAFATNRANDALDEGIHVGGRWDHERALERLERADPLDREDAHGLAQTASRRWQWPTR